MKVQEFLSEEGVPFNALEHPTTFSAQRMAHSLDVPGDNVAKTVVLKVDGEHVLIVLQATRQVDLAMVRDVLNAEHVELAPEKELAVLFSDCELGAIPPFGSRYGVKTFVDRSLTEDEYIVFEGNSHDEAISMRYFDFDNIEHPQIVAVTRLG